MSNTLQPVSVMAPLPSRRALLGAAGAAGAFGAVMASGGPARASGAGSGRAPLRFRGDGTFRVVQINDTQDDQRIDRRTVELIGAVLDQARPDLVVIVGDIITDGPSTRLEALQALNNVIAPIEERGVAWAATFGNHDEDSTAATGVDEEAMLAFFRRYPHNVNPPGADVTGTGNGVLKVGSGAAGSRRAAAAVWLFDSGRYRPDQIAGQSTESLEAYDWVRQDQVAWYADVSRRLERRNGRPVPGLAFAHIPLWEHRYMWWGSVEERTDASHAAAVARHGITGERNEREYPGAFNSGLYAAMLGRGDVRGYYCGHDHINTYDGDYYGVRLGYGPGTGFGTYGLGGERNHHLRGARVFELSEDVDGALVSTRPVFARDLGVDVSAGDQPRDPLPLPDWVR